MNAIGYIGLGAMGSQLARQLIPHGDLYVWDINPAATADFAREGATVSPTAAELARTCKVIFLCLPRSVDVRNLIFGSAGLLEGLQSGTVIVDQTSGIPEQTRAIAHDLERYGVLMLDAPVAGGVAAAAAGRITVMASGSKQAFGLAEPALRTMTTTVTYCGERVGDGQAIKAINNVMNASCRLLNLEVVAMGRKAGLGLDLMIDVINQSSGRSRISENALPALLANKPSSDFSLPLMVKDVDQAIAMGGDVGAPMPIASLTRSLLQMGINLVGPDARLEDMVSIIGKMAGISLYGPTEPATLHALPTTVSPGSLPVIGYVGLGAMGSALAKQARRSSSKFYLFDKDAERARALGMQDAHIASDLPELARECDVIMICVPTASEVREVIFGNDGLVSGLTAGKTIVDQTTTGPNAARKLADDLKSLNVAFVDAPVAGGPKSADERRVVTLCGGSPADVEKIEGILRSFSSQVIYFGPAGSGQAAKLVKNALGACNRLISYEALSAALKIGVPLDVLSQVIGKSSGWTAAFDRVVENLKTGAPTADIRLTLLAKDLRLISDMAVQVGAPMTIANLVRCAVESAVNVVDKDARIDALRESFDLRSAD